MPANLQIELTYYLYVYVFLDPGITYPQNLQINFYLAKQNIKINLFLFYIKYTCSYIFYIGK